MVAKKNSKSKKPATRTAKPVIKKVVGKQRPDPIAVPTRAAGPSATPSSPACTTNPNMNGESVASAGPSGTRKPKLITKKPEGEQRPNPTVASGTSLPPAAFACASAAAPPASTPTAPAAPSSPSSSPSSSGLRRVQVDGKWTYETDLPVKVGDKVTVLVPERLRARLGNTTTCVVSALESRYTGPCSRILAIDTGKPSLAAKLAIQQAVPERKDDSPHLTVIARAGTGKTTTIIEGMKHWKGMKTKITPSEQQRRVWDEIKRSPPDSSCVFVAFNHSIAAELKERVPAGVQAMTMHSMGMRSLLTAFPKLRSFDLKQADWVVPDRIAEVMGVDRRALRRTDPILITATNQLVSLCKMNLVSLDPCGNAMGEGDPDWTEALDAIVEHHRVELDKYRKQVYDLVPKVLARCRDPLSDGKFNFDDMIWLPIVLNLPLTRYEVLFGDEVQDWNRCQQEVAKRAGKRLILVGDDRQSIYGFAGADSDSIPRLQRELSGYELYQDGKPCAVPGLGSIAAGRGCVVLPLTVTRRCGRAIVAEAKKYVPDFEAHASNPEGSIGEGTYPTDKDGKARPEPHYMTQVEDGDFILCRTNAPLVRECFRFIKQGRKANIQGRDVGDGLIQTVKMLYGKGWDYEQHSVDVPDLVGRLSDWHAREMTKENAKRNPSPSTVQTLDDRLECLMCFCDRAIEIVAGRNASRPDAEKRDAHPSDVVSAIEEVFTDDKTIKGIRLSSIHKAKGLEAGRVFYLQPPGVTMPTFKMRGWELQQEENLKYVAITRAISELVFVS